MKEGYTRLCKSGCQTCKLLYRFFENQPSSTQWSHLLHPLRRLCVVLHAPSVWEGTPLHPIRITSLSEMDSMLCLLDSLSISMWPWSPSSSRCARLGIDDVYIFFVFCECPHQSCVGWCVYSLTSVLVLHRFYWFIDRSNLYNCNFISFEEANGGVGGGILVLQWRAWW